MDVRCRNQRLTFYSYYQCKTFLKTCFYQWEVVFFPSPIIYLLLKFFIVFLYRKYYSRISKISWRSLFFSFAIFVVSIYSFRGNFILISVVKYFKWIVHFRLCNCVVLLFNCPFLWKKARINNNVAFQNCFSCYFVGGVFTALLVVVKMVMLPFRIVGYGVQKAPN